MGRQKLKTEASREQILEAALPLFSHQGYGATSMRQIADDAGLSIGNLYHHFGSKEAIFQTLIERYWEHLLDPGLRLNQVLATHGSPMISKIWQERSNRSSMPIRTRSF